MSESFQVGDVVRLKSGGPAMTVENTGKDGVGKPYVRCTWFNDATKASESFAPAALEKSERGDKLSFA